MSQTTTSIFASPGMVFPGARSQSYTGPTASILPRLTVSDSSGKALQSWDLKLPKGTLGSAESCTICCRLPGIAPLHAMLVSGSQQAFVRSLAGQLSQDGVPSTELLLSDDKCYFEISGYRFTLVRGTSAPQQESARRDAKRIQFALARPFNLAATPTPPDVEEVKAKEVSAPWVANVIRDAIAPLEAQIDSLLLPLAEFQSQSLQAQFSNARIEEERRAAAEKQRSAKEQEIVGMVVQQSATMETLAERISDVNQQLSTIERIIAQDAEANSAANTEIGKVISVQQTAIEQLQNGIVSVSDSLQQLQERQQTAQRENSTWKNEVQQQLQQLTHAVSEFSSIAESADQSALVAAIESLKQTHELAQAEIGRWQSGVQRQLTHLEETLSENERNSQTEVPAAIAAALSEIQAKHAQSLEELHSWKAELKLEMQQLFQSASAATAIPFNSAATVQNVTPETNYHAQQGGSQVHGVATQAQPDSVANSHDWSSYSTSSVVGQEAGIDFNEPVVQELIDENYLSQMQSPVESNSAAQVWGNEHSFIASQGSANDEAIEPETDWPVTPNGGDQYAAPVEPEAHYENSWPTMFGANEVHNSIDSFGSNESDPQDAAMDAEDSPFMTLQVEHLDVYRNEPSVSREIPEVVTPSNPMAASGIPQEVQASNRHGEQSPAEDQDLDSFVTVKDPVGKTMDQPTLGEAETTGAARLPAWWTDDDEGDTSPEVSSANPQTHEQSTSVALESSPSITSLNDNTIESSLTSLVEGESNSQTSESAVEDEQFFGFGLDAAQAVADHQIPSSVMSIDQLALQADEPNHPENIFDLAAQYPESRAESPAAHSTPANKNSPANFEAENAAPEDESVEAYMKSLLARMRGESVEAPASAKPAAPTAPSGSSASVASPQLGLRQSMAITEDSTEQAAPFDFENYVPLTNAPEKGKNLSALRDLANSTARTAIHKSSRNRTLSGSLMKFAIAAIAFTVAAALLAINGLVVNVALCATIAALFVGLVWSYDGLKSLKPLLQNSLVLQPKTNQHAEADE